jgi:hypothetical protein
MNSPSIKNGHYEGRVVIVLITVLLLTEISLRIFENKLSGNIAHIFSIPSIVAQTDEFHPGQSLIFLGNSLTNNAVNKDLINTSFSLDTEQPVQTLKITPDGTALADWYCIYRNNFNNLKHAPSHLFIGFAWGQLSDQYSINPTRLGGFFCDTNDIGYLSDTGLMKHQQLLRFMAGTVSHVYVNREAIRNKILSIVIPDYQIISQKLNQTSEAQENKSQTNTKKHTYKLLENFIDTTKKSGTQVILIAMPVMNNYELDNDLILTIKDLELPFIDMRQHENISPYMYKDSIHLNRNGSEQFSKDIIESIKPYFKG